MLDRHQVGQKCGTDEAPGMLSSWKMTKNGCPDDKNRRFDYHCDSGFWPMDAWKNCHKTATPENELVSRSLAYLDGHIVACPLGKAMKWWQVFAGAKGKAEGKVEMVCCDIPNYDSGMASEIKHKRSVCAHNIDDKTIDYMDQYTDVDCGQGNVMTKWRLNYCEGKNMLVEYSCIPVPDLKKKHEGTVLGSRELVRGRVAVQQSLIDPTLA